MATELEQGIYVYPSRLTEERVTEPRNINTLDDLKREVVADINAERQFNFEGWNPENYTDRNTQEFNQKYDKQIEKVQDGSIGDVLKVMSDNNMILSRQHPLTIQENYYDDIGKNRLWIQPQELKLSGDKIEFTRVELPRNVERQLQVSLGTVQGVKEREQDRGHFAVVKDRFGDNYSMVRVDKTPEGHQLNVKRGFPTLEAAENQMENQLKRESIPKDKPMEKEQSMELSR